MAKSLKKLDFSNKKTYLVDGCFYLPVPKGYHYSDNKSIIGDHRRFILVPDNYKLSDDPMQAPLGLSILEVKISVGGEFTPEYTDALVQYLAENTSIFDESILVRKTASRNGFEAVYQRWYNKDDNTWIKLQGVFFTNETAYVFNLINNLEGETYSDKVADILCDVANDWFNRIRLADEVGKPFFMYAKPDEDLYPHYDKLLSSGSAFAGMNVTVVTNASGTEFSCLPVDVIFVDHCKKKYQKKS